MYKICYCVAIAAWDILHYLKHAAYCKVRRINFNMYRTKLSRRTMYKQNVYTPCTQKHTAHCKMRRTTFQILRPRCLRTFNANKERAKEDAL